MSSHYDAAVEAIAAARVALQNGDTSVALVYAAIAQAEATLARRDDEMLTIRQHVEPIL